MEDGGGSRGGGVGSGGGGPVPFCILPTASTSTNSSLLADISNLTFPSRVKRRSPEQVPVQNKRARRVEGPGNPKNFLDNTSSSAESGDEIHSQDGQRKPREKVVTRSKRRSEKTKSSKKEETAVPETGGAASGVGSDSESDGGGAGLRGPTDVGLAAGSSQETPLPSEQKTKTKKKSKKLKNKQAPKNAQSMTNKELKAYNKRIKTAMVAWATEDYESLRDCAKAFNIPKSTLYDRIKAGPDAHLSRPGKKSKVMTPAEEKRIVDHIQFLATVNKTGVSFTGLRSLLQTVLLAIHKAQPGRANIFEKENFLPSKNFVQSFTKRHKLSTVKSKEISHGRKQLKAADIEEWFAITECKFFSDPELQEAIQDPSRVFNTDETGVRMGQEKRNVLVKTGTKEVQHLTNGSGSRTSISVSFTVSADGGIVPPRALYKVSKNYATGKLSKMPCDGKSGKWKVSSSPKGFQTAATFINVLEDLLEYAKEKELKFPLILFLDQANSHITLEISKFCRENAIQLWFFVPNASHIQQPLDLTYFGPLKYNYRREIESFTNLPLNAGRKNILDKWTILDMLRRACDKTPDESIIAGFEKAGIIPWDPAQVQNMFPKGIQETSSDQDDNGKENEEREGGDVDRAGQDAVEPDLPLRPSHQGAVAGGGRGAGATQVSVPGPTQGAPRSRSKSLGRRENYRAQSPVAVRGEDGSLDRAEKRAEQEAVNQAASLKKDELLTTKIGGADIPSTRLTQHNITDKSSEPMSVYSSQTPVGCNFVNRENYDKFEKFKVMTIQEPRRTEDVLQEYGISIEEFGQLQNEVNEVRSFKICAYCLGGTEELQACQVCQQVGYCNSYCEKWNKEEHTTICDLLAILSANQDDWDDWASNRLVVDSRLMRLDLEKHLGLWPHPRLPVSYLEMWRQLRVNIMAAKLANEEENINNNMNDENLEDFCPDCFETIEKSFTMHHRCTGVESLRREPEEDLKTKLQKFEVIFVGEKLKQYIRCYNSGKRYKPADPLYKAWLVLKLESEENGGENAVADLFQKYQKVAPEATKKRVKKRPNTKNKFDPTSNEFFQTLGGNTEQEEEEFRDLPNIDEDPILDLVKKKLSKPTPAKPSKNRNKITSKTSSSVAASRSVPKSSETFSAWDKKKKFVPPLKDREA